MTTHEKQQEHTQTQQQKPEPAKEQAPAPNPPGQPRGPGDMSAGDEPAGNEAT